MRAQIISLIFSKSMTNAYFFKNGEPLDEPSFDEGTEFLCFPWTSLASSRQLTQDIVGIQHNFQTEARLSVGWWEKVELVSKVVNNGCRLAEKDIFFVIM